MYSNTLQEHAIISLSAIPIIRGFHCRKGHDDMRCINCSATIQKAQQSIESAHDFLFFFKDIKIIFFYFLKIMFDISTSKQFKNIKKY
jgi:hypothetical protein